MTAKDQDDQMPQTLTAMREAAGLDQSEVALRMGVSRGRVAHIEARYPNLHYTSLTKYLKAIGREVVYTTPDGQGVPASRLIPDPSKTATRAYLDERASKAGRARMKREASAAEELPLQSDQPDPGGNDTGGNVDQTDPESDQSDSGERQQP